MFRAARANLLRISFKIMTNQWYTSSKKFSRAARVNLWRISRECGPRATEGKHNDTTMTPRSDLMWWYDDMHLQSMLSKSDFQISNPNHRNMLYHSENAISKIKYHKNYSLMINKTSLLRAAKELPTPSTKSPSFAITHYPQTHQL